MRLNCWKCVVLALLAFWFVAPIAQAQDRFALGRAYVMQQDKALWLWNVWSRQTDEFKNANPWAGKNGFWCETARLSNIPCDARAWRNIPAGKEITLPVVVPSLEKVQPNVTVVQSPPAPMPRGAEDLRSSGTQVSGLHAFVTSPVGRLSTIVVLLIGVLILLASFARKKEKQNAMLHEVLGEVREVNYKLPFFALRSGEHKFGERNIPIRVVKVRKDGEFKVKPEFAEGQVLLYSELDNFLWDAKEKKRALPGIRWFSLRGDEASPRPNESRSTQESTQEKETGRNLQGSP